MRRKIYNTGGYRWSIVAPSGQTSPTCTRHVIPSALQHDPRKLRGLITQNAISRASENVTLWCDRSSLCWCLDLSDAFLCRSEQKYHEECSAGEFSSAPAAIFFLSFLVFGVGTSLYHTLGISYLDDNAKKNKTPFLLGNRSCIKIPCRNVKDLSLQNLTSPRVLAWSKKVLLFTTGVNEIKCWHKFMFRERHRTKS